MKPLDCILLIDDNSDDNYFHTLVIKRSGAAEQVETVTRGEQALEYLEKRRSNLIHHRVPDLIFVDINMPGMNGFEFLEKAKGSIDPGKTVVVMLTSSQNPDDEQKAKEEFPDVIKDFKTKPLTVEMLNEIMERFFSGHFATYH